VRQAPVVHHDGIRVPEIESRQIAGQNLLRLNILRSTPGRISALGRVVEQGVEPRIGLVAAICALGCKAGG
jgi:hypothetical protein